MRKLTAKARKLLDPDMNKELAPIYAEANCKDCPSEWFFPEIVKGRMSIQPGSNLHCALLTCNECKVKQKCFDFADRNGCIGIWGGRIFNYKNISEINKYGDIK